MESQESGARLENKLSDSALRNQRSGASLEENPEAGGPTCRQLGPRTISGLVINVPSGTCKSHRNAFLKYAVRKGIPPGGLSRIPELFFAVPPSSLRVPMIPC